MNRARTRQRRWTVLGAALLTATAGWACYALEGPAPPTPQRAHFDKLFEQWTVLLRELWDLDVEYRTASAEQRPAIKPRYDQRVEGGRKMQGPLIEAAAVAYAKDPRRSGDLGQFLTGVVRLEVAGENYEDALRLAQLLLDNSIENPVVFRMAAVCAFATNRFGLAERHLRVAREKGVLDDLTKRYFADLPYYQEAWQREEKLRYAEKTDNLPRVLLRTNRGEIELELFENEAPNTAANFIHLVEKGFYDGLTFHRVLPQSLAQAGCPQGDGSGGPGYTIRCECYRPDHRRHFRGSLSMVNSGRDTGGSQFFIAFVPQRNLDGKHTVFGRVVRGIEVLARLTRRNPTPLNKNTLPEADKILEARVLRKRPHPYHPEITPVPEKVDPLKILEEL